MREVHEQGGGKAANRTHEPIYHGTPALYGMIDRFATYFRFFPLIFCQCCETSVRYIAWRCRGHC